MVVVVDRRALAQEFGVDADAEVATGTLSGCRFKRRKHDAFHGARQHRAAHHDDLVGVAARERGADLFAGAAHIGQIEAAVRVAGRADAYEHQIRTRDGGIGIGDGSEMSGGHACGHQLLEAWLYDRALALVHETCLHVVGIDADDLMAVAREAPRRDDPDVPHPENRNPHSDSCPSTGALKGCEVWHGLEIRSDTQVTLNDRSVLWFLALAPDRGPANSTFKRFPPRVGLRAGPSMTMHQSRVDHIKIWRPAGSETHRLVDLSPGPRGRYAPTFSSVH